METIPWSCFVILINIRHNYSVHDGHNYLEKIPWPAMFCHPINIRHNYYVLDGHNYYGNDILVMFCHPIKIRHNNYFHNGHNYYGLWKQYPGHVFSSYQYKA